MSRHLYRYRLWWRSRLPWMLINMGIARKGKDCHNVNAKHSWYKIDDNYKGCYYCRRIEKYKLEVKYPFSPKSNKKLNTGDFWAIKLSDKSFCVGVVIDIPPEDLRLTREIIVGLLNWNERKMPELEDFNGLEVLEQGHAHIKTITHEGSEILGNIDLEKYNINPLIMIDSYGANGTEDYLMKGYEIIRKFKQSDRGKYDRSGYWGYNFIDDLADHHFIKNNNN